MYKRVYIIGVDGAGNFFNKTPTPAMDRIMADGAITYNMTTSRPTISAQCWGSMFHGVDADRHRLNNSIAGQTRYANPRFPSFMKVIRDAEPEALLASFCCWGPINYGIVESDIDVVKIKADDELLTQKTCEYLEQNDPKVLFVHFDSVDSAGHRNGYGTPAHLSRITDVDGMIGRIYATAEEKGYADDLLFIITSDHGGTPPNENGRGSHGGDSDAEKICLLAACGKSVKKGTIGECNIKDVASIVLSAFGLDQPDTWTSRVPEDFFIDVVGGGERPVEPDFEPPKARRHVNLSTPESSLFGIEDAIGQVRAYYPFDGNTRDLKNGRDFEYEGKLYYTEGYHGTCATLNDGHLITDIPFGVEDFSISFWVRLSPPPVVNRLLSNMSFDEAGKRVGFTLTMLPDCIETVLYGREGKRSNSTVSYPENEYDGWMHFLASVDRANKKIAIYTDFKKVEEYTLLDSLNDFSLDGGRLRTQEGGMSLSLDELIIAASPVTEEQVTALGKYYGL